jgi:predicted  nucleic acid-binding Zn-ribbon protein
MDIEKKLLEMKKKIDEGKTQKAQAEGKLEHLMSRLEKDFGYKTIEDAEKGIQEMETVIEKKEKEIEKEIINMEESHEWSEA